MGCKRVHETPIQLLLLLVAVKSTPTICTDGSTVLGVSNETQYYNFTNATTLSTSTTFYYEGKMYWSIIDFVLGITMLGTFVYACFFLLAVGKICVNQKQQQPGQSAFLSLDQNKSNDNMSSDDVDDDSDDSGGIAATRRSRQQQRRKSYQISTTNMLRDNERRNNSFNMYLFFIILPDALLNGTNGVDQIYEALTNGKHPHNIFPLCEIDIGFNFFYYFTNVYMNAILAHEIYKLVIKSNQRKRANPPTTLRVLKQVFAVYLFTTLLSIWYMLDVPWSPFGFQNMTYCITKAGSPTSSQDEKQIFSKTATSFMSYGLVLLPFLYVFCIGFVVWNRKLLPFRGRTRAISLYFFRIIVVFICLYIPNLVIAGIIANRSSSTINVYDNERFWIYNITKILMPLQCIITIKSALVKDDVNKAVNDTSTALRRSILKMFCHFTLRSGNVSSENILPGCTEVSGDEEEGEHTADPTTRINEGGNAMIGSEWYAEDVYDDGEQKIEESVITEQD